MLDFAARVLAWFDVHGRHDLPWQDTRDAYRIWLSEIMLQQTQVATVIPYYLRFLERFPAVSSLASAPLDEAMQAWAGLGYYSRARNLHACAQAVMRDHGGQFPRSAQLLQTLPGIGRSTAAAIAAFSAGERVAILDGNVKRLLARHHAIDGFPGAPAVERELWIVAESLLPQQDIESYTQAMMDLGATICLRKRPLCAICPVNQTCLARKLGRTEELPTPRPRALRPTRTAAVMLIRDSTGAVLLERRPPSGIWGGLSSLPEFDSELSDDQLLEEVSKRYGLAVDGIEHFGNVKHEFTHYSFVMRPRRTQVRGATNAAHDSNAWWLPTEQLLIAALPSPIRKLLLRVASEATLL